MTNRFISLFRRTRPTPDPTSHDFAYPNAIIDANGHALPLDALISRLRQASIDFRTAWSRNDRGEAMRSSDVGRQCLDFVAAQILKKRNRFRVRSSSRSEMKAIFDRPFGRMVTTATMADFEALFAIAAGEGALAGTLGPPTTCTFAAMLEHIARRHDYYMNFRLDGECHILLLCVTDEHGEPNGIIEFEMRDFCDHCQAVARLPS